MALFGVLLVVPFELGFVESPDEPDPTGALWIFNRVLDSIFWTDVLFNLVMSFELAPIDEMLAEEAQRTIMSGGSSDVLAASARYEGRLSRIWLAYAKGWFIIDVASSIPSMFDIYKVYEVYHGEGRVDGNPTNQLDGNDDNSMALMRLGRTAKLGNFLKLVKILKVGDGTVHAHAPQDLNFVPDGLIILLPRDDLHRNLLARLSTAPLDHYAECALTQLIAEHIVLMDGPGTMCGRAGGLVMCRL